MSWTRTQIEMASEVLAEAYDGKYYKLALAVEALLEDFDDHDKALSDKTDDYDSISEQLFELDEENSELRSTLEDLRGEYETLNDAYEGIQDALRSVNVQD